MYQRGLIRNIALCVEDTVRGTLYSATRRFSAMGRLKRAAADYIMSFAERPIEWSVSLRFHTRPRTALHTKNSVLFTKKKKKKKTAFAEKRRGICTPWTQCKK